MGDRERDLIIVAAIFVVAWFILYPLGAWFDTYGQVPLVPFVPEPRGGVKLIH